MLKTCTECGDAKDISDFHRRKKGKSALRTICKTCKNKNRAAIRERLRIIRDLAKDVPCTDCGVKYPPWIMDFDHMSDNKYKDISDLVQYAVSEEKLRTEIAKCEVVCANCHRARSHYRVGGGVIPFSP